MARRSLAALFLLTAALGVAGCSSDVDDARQEDLAARGGKTFVYYGEETCREADPCETLVPALVGGEIQLFILTPRRTPEERSAVRFDDARVDVIASMEEETCFRGVGAKESGGRLVPLLDHRTVGCPEADARYAIHTISVRPKLAGPVSFDVVDRERRLIKRATFEAREAANLLVSVDHTSPAQPDGSYSLRVGSSIGFSVTPKDASDLPLRSVRNTGLTFTWDDTEVVEPSTAETGADHLVVARKPGTARLTIKAGTAEKTIVVNTFDF